jgi:hypothetical protein
MPKRLQRLFPADFPTRLADLAGVEIHVVRRDGVTLRGRLLSHDATSLELRDPLRQRHVVRLGDVEEIVWDKVAAW